MKRETMARVLWTLVILVGVVCVMASHAQPPGLKSTVLQRGDVSIPGREIVMVQNETIAGARVPRHTHPGEEVGYLLEGTLLLEVEGKSPLSLKTGDVFLIEAGRPHNVTNEGTGTARVLSTYIIEKGAPIVSWVP